MLLADIRVREVSYSYEEYRYRTPIKFGGVALDRVTILNVDMQVENRHGKCTRSFGSMPLSNTWAFPSRVIGYDNTLAAMRVLAEWIAGIYRQSTLMGHPIDITHTLEPEFFSAADEVTRELGLTEPLPPLATLVVASAFDAALHDAYGKSLGLNCYHTYSRELLPHDLGHYLGKAFTGEHLSDYILTDPVPQLPLYHLVGALDLLTPEENTQPLNDGMPETLGDWIRRDGLTHLKIKLNGDDLNWDVDRVMRVNAVTEEVQSRRGVNRWVYSLDFNERCQNVAYLLEFLHRLQQLTPRAYERVQYIEQPTARDLTVQPPNRMHEAAKLKPVVIDESLISLESLYQARDLGYTGVAFKACKGQTQSLLLAAASQKLGLFRCVQDLTCPGASLIHSAGLAAHIPGVAAIEANSRQYVPAANREWDARFPGLFTITDGLMNTAQLRGPGLGAVE